MRLALPNLAAFRFRHVLASEGGPVERLRMAELSVLGRREFLANAYLRVGLAGDHGDRVLYSPAHGSGTSPSPMIARFMAVSEAMERWAHWQLHRHGDRHRFGFDLDPSSNGLAAFPGVFSRQARPYAQMEAAERFNLLHWWEGYLPAAESDTIWPGVQAATICSEAPGVTVVLFRRLDDGHYCYGHAAAMDYAVACRKAAVEMERHAQVIARFARSCAGHPAGDRADHLSPVERRCLFFASEAGHELFIARLRSTPRRVPARPKLVFDGVVPGPWSRYADVWRVLYEPPSDRFLLADDNYFLW